jgi:hypothetical protein
MSDQIMSVFHPIRGRENASDTSIDIMQWTFMAGDTTGTRFGVLVLRAEIHVIAELKDRMKSDIVRMGRGSTRPA